MPVRAKCPALVCTRGVRETAPAYSDYLFALRLPVCVCARAACRRPMLSPSVGYLSRKGSADSGKKSRQRTVFFLWRGPRDGVSQRVRVDEIAYFNVAIEPKHSVAAPRGLSHCTGQEECEKNRQRERCPDGLDSCT